jgi:hypothetical protein
MSEAPHVPFTETKAPESAERLNRGALGLPYAALGVIVVSIIYATVLVRRDPGVGDRVGSIIADE